MKEKYLPDHKYYKFSTGCFCAVLVDEATMRRINKVLYKATAEVKNILYNAEDVLPYNWGLVNIYDDSCTNIKKQRVYYYPNWYTSKEQCIKYMNLCDPSYISDLYMISTEKERLEVKADIEKEMLEDESTLLS